MTVVGLSPLPDDRASVGWLRKSGLKICRWRAWPAVVGCLLRRGDAAAFHRGTQFGAAGSSRSQYVTVEGGRDSSTNYAIDGDTSGRCDSTICR